MQNTLPCFSSGHELKILDRIRDIKESQRDEAKEMLESLIISKNIIELRRQFYASREFMNSSERQYYNSLTDNLELYYIQNTVDMQARIAYMIPDAKMAAPTSAGMTIGGTNIGNALKAFSGYLGNKMTENNLIGSMANVHGGYQRRMDDWKLQTKIAEQELKQLDKQMIAAEIRFAIAEKDLENHDMQVENSREVDDYMRSKFSNLELYEWMTKEIFTVYAQSYQLAYTTARKAEKCLCHELGLDKSSYINFGYWDNLKEGLLSGEKLQYDLRRLENAFLENNKRELEIIRHISLRMLDPMQVLLLQQTGKCDIKLPEVLFDLDFPGHFFRRIKSISISMPCVAGPYTSVNTTLKLTKNKYRTNNNDGDYAQTDEEKNTWGIGRFRSISSPVTAIATSNAQSDSGMFELNFRDERYLPFEGCGAISEWSLELNNQFRQFSYNTISDVIIHLHYTAREENKIPNFKVKVNEYLEQYFTNLFNNTSQPFIRMFSLKQDFPNAFHQLINSDPQKTEIVITKDHFNRLFYNRNINTTQVEILLTTMKNEPVSAPLLLSVDFNNTSLKIENASDWIDAPFNENFKQVKQTFINGFDPLGKVSIEAGTDAGNDGLRKDEIDDVLIKFEFNVRS